LAVIVLLLQLTSSNGTFPGELLPKFFKTVGPYLPFTYSISALREIDSGISRAVLIKDITVLSIIMFTFLIFSILLKRHSDTLKAKMRGENLESKDIQQEIANDIENITN
jgi:putative membrane protein